MQANLRQLLDEGQTGRHEPPFDPDPDDYVSWDYASGYADGDRRGGRARGAQRPARPRGAHAPARHAVATRVGPAGPRTGDAGPRAPAGRLLAAVRSGGSRVSVIMPRRKPVATASARSLAPSLRNSRRAWVLMVSSDR